MSLALFPAALFGRRYVAAVAWNLLECFVARIAAYMSILFLS